MAQRTPNPPAASAKPRYRVTNWRDYNRALVARGAITLWIDEGVLAGWRATGGKGLRYSAAAMLCALSLRAVFRMPPAPDTGLSAQPEAVARADDRHPALLQLLPPRRRPGRSR